MRAKITKTKQISISIHKNNITPRKKSFYIKDKLGKKIYVLEKSSVISLQLKKKLKKVELYKVLGGKKDDEAFAIEKAGDGGYIIGGWTYSKEDYYNTADAWIIKLDKYGNKEWEKTFGKYGYNEVILGITKTKDNGYILTGGIASFGNGGSDLWVMKLNHKGEKEWAHMLEKDRYDKGYSIIETDDGGFIIAGVTGSEGHGGFDYWILKFNKEGKKEWEKIIGGILNVKPSSIILTKDGGYLVVGYSESVGFGDEADGWVIKLDKLGNIEWAQNYGNLRNDKFFSAVETDDGGYLLAGYTTIITNENVNGWLIKIDKKEIKFGRKILVRIIGIYLDVLKNVIIIT